MQKLLPSFQRGLFISVTVTGAIVNLSPTTHAQTIFPSIPNLQFQTSSPRRCANIGDWYTTDGKTGTTGTTPTNCGSAFGGQNTTSTDKIHRLVFNLTKSQLDAAGGAITITVNDAESTSGTAPDPISDEVSGRGDPTQFSLRAADGITILQGPITVPSGSPDKTSVTFTITTPGVYQVTSVAGAGPISGDNTADLNDDDNTFTLTASISGVLIGFFQGTTQFSVNRTTPYSLYFLKPPTTTSTTLFLRNFDYDNSPSTIQYISPPGGSGSFIGTRSNDAVWNGSSSSLNNGGDTVSATPLTDAGIWEIRVSNTSAINQFILEANANGERLVIFDAPPPTAGNFTLTANTTLSTTIGTTVCHPFTVKNSFFSNDIINLTTSNTNASYTIQLRNASGTTALTDTDGNGQVDTGILTPGQTGNYTLCVTPNVGATTADVTRINAVSFLDTKANAASNTTLFIDKTTTLPPPPQLSLVKRITEIDRVSISGFRGNSSDPNGNGNTNEDTRWPTDFNTYLRGLIDGGLVKPNGEVEYTIYFLVTQNATNNVTVCDLVPDNQTFVADGYNNASPRPLEPGALSGNTGIGLALSTTGLPSIPTVYLTNENDSDRGRYYPPNTPNTPNICQKRDTLGNVIASGSAANTNGAIVVNIVQGAIQLPAANTPGNPSNSYGFIRFKAKVN